MKSAFTFIAIALVVIMWAPQQSMAVVSNLNCKGEVCGQITTADGKFCRLFPNQGRLDLYNCESGKSFTKVAIAKCCGLIAGEVAKPCAPVAG